MTLDVNYTKIKDWETVTRLEDGTLNPVTKTLAFASMITGIGEITEKTAPDVYARIHLHEKLHGAFLVMGENAEPRYITPEDVVQHIGLSTNVFPNDTDTKWVNRVIRDGALRTNRYAFNQAIYGRGRHAAARQ